MKSLNTLFKVFMVMLLTAGSVSAQYVTVGTTGQGTNGVNAQSPVNIYYQSLHYQTIYTVAELQAAGFASGATIQEIGWDVVGAPINAMPNYTLAMGHTANATSGTANYVPTSGLTQVYNNALYAPTAGGFDMLVMSTPFIWNGTDNLVVDICFDPVSAWNSSGTCSTYPSTDGSTSIRSDPSPMCGIAPNASNAWKPVAQFFIVNSAAPSCAMPNNDLAATNITDVSADLSWTHPGTPTQYMIEYGPQGFVPGSGTMVSPNPTASPVSLSSLSAATDYTARVVAICGTAVGDTSYARAVNFATTCAATNMAPVTESFEGASIVCLSSSGGVLTSGGGWQNPGWVTSSGNFYGPAAPFEGSGFLLFNTEGATTGTTDTLFMVPVDATALTSPFLDFAYYLEDNFGLASFDMQIDSAGTWKSIFARSTDQGSDWKFASIDLTPYAASNISLRIVGTQNGGYIGAPAIDRLRIKEAPVTACAALMAPDTTGFEDGGALNACWEQATNDSLDWTIQTGPTGSGGTGPSGANSGSYYAYFESSSPVGTGDHAILVSPPINTAMLADAPALYFNYHMFGNDSMKLRVEYEIFGSDVWQPLWEQMGSIQSADTDPYEEAYVPIPGAAGSIMRLRFVAIAGTNNGNAPGPGFAWQSDMAIDDIRVQNVLANDVAVTAVMTPGNDCGLGVQPVTIEITNRGFNAQSSVPVFVSVNGGTPVGATIPGPIASNGGTATVDVLVDMATLGHYDITANTALMMDEVPTNDIMMGSAYHQPQIATDYSEEFEGTDGYWYAEGDWAQGAPAGTVIDGAGAGMDAFVTNLAGNYSDAATSYLYSPCFDLSSMTAPFLRFSINWDIEDDWDGAWLEISTGGGSWSKLGANNLAGQNWYNDSVPNNSVDWAWSGTGADGSGGWVDAIIDLSTYGVTVATDTRFRFVMFSDGNTNNEGLGIDNFGIFDGCLDAVLNETVMDESTAGSTDGSIMLNPVAGFGGYTFVWSDGSTGNGISGLAPGTYDVTVTDQFNCSTSGSFTIGTLCPADLGLSTTATPTLGDGTSDGAAQIIATGGTAPYTYAWDNGTTNDYAFNLSGGDYTIVVTDANGCTDTAMITIETNYMISTDEIEGLTGLNISPNPAKDYAQLNIAFDRSVELTVRIADVTGRVLETRNAGNTTAQEMRFDVSNLAEGVYFMQIIADGQVATKRFVIVK